MEIGEYIRTDKGIISKINSGVDIDMIEFEDAIIGNIVKHSKNIIDLIQCGDYVNGDEVIAIDYDEDENGNAFNVLGVYDIDDDYAYTIELSRIHIKTILTKEQYEQNSYKL